MGDDAAVVDQGFEPARGVTITHHLNAFEGFPDRRASGMGAYHADFKQGGQPFRQFMHEAGFRVARPAGIRRRQHEETRFGGFGVHPGRSLR